MKKLMRKRLLKYFFLFIIVAPCSIKAQKIDILIKGGHVIDPKNNIDGVMDVAIANGKIQQVAASIPAANATKVVNASGLYVTPGLIDMHGHVFYGTDPESYLANGMTGLPPDGFTFRSGVTTLVDCGSSGWRNFRQFKRQTIDKAQTRILAFLNIVGTGMYSRFEEQDTTDMNPEMAANMITKLFPDLIVGIKSAHFWGGFTSVDRAVTAGKLANVPVIVDFGEHHPPNSIEELFMKHLRPGDMFTHTYSYGPKDRETVVDENGKVKPFIFEAQKRGIIFDVGHGGGAFSWKQAIPAMQQGFLPNVISTDLHTQSMNGGMKDMSNVISKFLAMGMSIQDAIKRSTWNPAVAINRKELGHLSVGADADVAVFSLQKGQFGYIDIRNVVYKGTQKLQPELTIRAGKVVWDLNGIAATPYDPKGPN